MAKRSQCECKNANWDRSKRVSSILLPWNSSLNIRCIMFFPLYAIRENRAEGDARWLSGYINAYTKTFAIFQMKTSGMKILIAVVMTVVVLATGASSTKDVRDICNYNIGGAKCSACCGRALVHCKLYCKNLGCDPYQKGVCDVKNSNKYFMYSFRAKGCPTCMNDRRRTLESDDPSAVAVNSRGFCDSCVKRALQNCQGPECNPSAVIQRTCGKGCL